MVENKTEDRRCGQCRETVGDVWQGYVHCAWLNYDVWAQSLMCKHGLDLCDCF